MTSHSPATVSKATIVRAPLERVLTAIGHCKLLPFLLSILVTRLLILAAVTRLTHAREFSNDVLMHMALIRHPMAILLFSLGRWDQNPPFLPILETILGYPLQRVLPEFLTIRLVMIAWEVVLGWIFLTILDVLRMQLKRRAYCILAFLVLPAGWITSAVMGQDDPIAACGFLLPLLFVAREEEAASIFASGIGFLAAKIFCAVELIDLVVLSSRRNWSKNLLAGFGPTAVVYAAITLHRRLHGFRLPLLNFHPNSYYGTNFWPVLRNYAGINLSTAGIYSGPIALAAALIPPLILRRLPEQARTPRLIMAATAASLLLFFSLFYHVEPEYYLMLSPVLVLTAESLGDSVSVLAVSALPWLGKFFQNAANLAAVSRTPGKLVYARLFYKVFHFAPAAWLAADQILFSIVTLYVAWRWCRKLRLKQPLASASLAPSS